MRIPKFSSLVVLGLALSSPMVIAQSQDGSEDQSKPAASSATGEVPAPSLVKFNVEFGAEYPFQTGGERWTKFLEHRDIPKNFTINTLDFTIGRDDSRWSLTGSAADAGQLDQRYRVALEKFGVSRSTFRFVGWPNFISRAVTLPYQQISPGVFSLPTPFRSAFESATTDATRISLVNDLVANTGWSNLRTRRDRFLFDQVFNITSHWFVNAGVMYERRNGFRPLGVGAYNRVAGPLGTGATWVAFSDELPEPVEFRNTEARAGIGYQSDRGMIHVEYIGSFFHNEIPNLIWSNPFEATACSTTVCPFPAAPGTAGRWRFDRDYINIAPNNHAHTVSLTTRFNLPGSSFFSALIAYSMRRQNSPFGPHTLSSATLTGVPAGVVLTDAATLPQSSLHGEVNTTTGNAALGTRHWKTLLLTAHYRAFHYDNNTPVVALPGIVDMSSFFTTNFDNTPVTTFEAPSSYLRQNASLEAVWRPRREFQFRVAPMLEVWNRQRRQVRRLNEWGGDTGFILEPAKWASVKVNYHYGNRDPRTPYVAAPNEFHELRDFDQDHRVTNNPSIVLNLGGKGPWLVSANYSYMSQAHDRNLFGLSKYLQRIGGVDLNYAPSDRWGVAVYYNHEQIGYAYRQIAKENPDTPEAFVLPTDEWDRATRDKVDSFGLAFNAASTNQKWQFSANYDFSLGRQLIRTTNPFPVQVIAFPIDAVGRPFPEVKSDFHELWVDSSYAFQPNWRAGLRYIFSPYRLTDFALDNLTPYLPTQSADPLPGTIDPQTNAVRFLTLNSHYGSSDSHMIGVYLKYTF